MRWLRPCRRRCKGADLFRAGRFGVPTSGKTGTCHGRRLRGGRRPSPTKAAACSGG